jgi:hypothetical protein
VTGNRVQDRHNFTLHEMTASTFTEMVHQIFREQTIAFKINVSFGFIPSVVSAWPLVSRAGHDGVLGCPVY